MTRTDPLYPLLQQDQLDDIVKRISMLLSLLEYCILLKGYDNVVRESFPLNTTLNKINVTQHIDFNKAQEIKLHAALTD